MLEGLCFWGRGTVCAVGVGTCAVGGEGLCCMGGEACAVGERSVLVKGGGGQGACYTMAILGKRVTLPRSDRVLFATTN